MNRRSTGSPPRSGEALGKEGSGTAAKQDWRPNDSVPQHDALCNALIAFLSSCINDGGALSLEEALAAISRHPSEGEE